MLFNMDGRGKNVGLRMLETFSLALDSGTSGCSKVLGVKELSSLCFRQPGMERFCIAIQNILKDMHARRF